MYRGANGYVEVFFPQGKDKCRCSHFIFSSLVQSNQFHIIVAFRLGTAIATFRNLTREKHTPLFFSHLLANKSHILDKYVNTCV